MTGKVYTRRGDSGTTGIIGAGDIRKDDPRLEACGTVDELNSHLGLARTIADRDGLNEFASRLSRIQNDLFNLGSALAESSPGEHSSMPAITPEQVARLEQWIDSTTESLPPLCTFILPGGTELNAGLHIARTVCRRAERTIVRHAETSRIPARAIAYINRLGDLLFVMARAAAHIRGAAEYRWEKT